MILDTIVGGIVYGIAGYSLCKLIITNHEKDKILYSMVIPAFFIYGYYKVYSIKNN